MALIFSISNGGMLLTADQIWLAAIVKVKEKEEKRSL